MTKDTRMGSDPLSWIGDSRKEPQESKPSKSSKQSLQISRDDAEIMAKDLFGKKSTQTGLKEGWTRATFIVREDYLESLKNLAYWERKELKKIVDEALASYLQGKKPRARIKET